MGILRVLENITLPYGILIMGEKLALRNFMGVIEYYYAVFLTLG